MQQTQHGQSVRKERFDQTPLNPPPSDEPAAVTSQSSWWQRFACVWEVCAPMWRGETLNPVPEILHLFLKYFSGGGMGNFQTRNLWPGSLFSREFLNLRTFSASSDSCGEGSHSFLVKNSCCDNKFCHLFVRFFVAESCWKSVISVPYIISLWPS